MSQEIHPDLKPHQNIFKKYGFTFVGKQVFSISERYFSFQTKNNSNQQFWVKIRKAKDDKTKKEIIRESQIIKLLDQNLNNKKNIIHTLRFVDSQIKKSPEWFIYKYAKGSPIGDIILGYKKSFLTKTNLAKIIKTFRAIHSLNISQIKLPRKKHGFYGREIKKYTSTLPLSYKLDSQTIKRAENFIKTNQQIINKTNLVLTHGDMFPQNILNYNNKYTVIDWGECHLNNPGFDLATIYFNAWRNPAWQTMFLIECSKLYDKNFVIYFTAVVIRQTLMMMSVYGNIYDHPEKWTNHWPYFQAKYYKKIKPEITKSFHAQSLALKKLLK